MGWSSLGFLDEGDISYELQERGATGGFYEAQWGLVGGYWRASNNGRRFFVSLVLSISAHDDVAFYRATIEATWTI